jgi:hypothetical protein
MMYFGHFGCGGAVDIAGAGVHVVLNDAFNETPDRSMGQPLGRLS